MRSLVTGDWHGDWTTAGCSRFQDVEGAVEETVQIAIKLKVDHYFMVGDLTNPDSGSCVFRVIELALRTALRLRAHSITSWWVRGNHDVIEDGTDQSTLTPLRALGECVHVVERPRVVTIADGEEVVFLPYAPTTHSYDPEAFMLAYLAKRSPECKRTYVIGHMTHIPGVIPGEETSEMPRGRAMAFPVNAVQGVDRLLMFNGHYHTPQKTAQGIHIPGALQRLTHGEEANAPGYLVVEAS